MALFMLSIAIFVNSSLGFLSAQDTPNAASNNTQKTATISGSVIDHSNRKPIRGALVELRLFPGEGKDVYSTHTDENGRFSIHNITPNTYILTASFNLFVTQQFGAAARGNPGVKLVLEPGQGLADLVFPLRRHSIVTGKITDTLGQSVAGATVLCLKPYFVRGKSEFRMVARASSNDLGEYRLFGLAPGTYIIGAIAPDIDSSETRSSHERNRA